MAAAMLSLSSCEELDDGEFDVFVRMDGEKLPDSGGSVFVVVTSSAEWNLTLETMDGSGEWGALSQSSGHGSKANIIFTYGKNTSVTERSAEIVLTSANGNREARFCVVQKAMQQGGDIPVPPDPPGPGPDPSDPVAAWLELPAMGEDAEYYTHTQTLGGKEIRSWSFLWDADALVAHWVAYPLNSWTIGSGSRTDNWGLDPKLSRDRQPVLYNAFKGGYDRGHQIPSADRLNHSANVTTFYGTNMTPQLAGLNQKTWANLEGQVRTWANAFDTLYVVTGCTVDGSTKFAYDNDGKQVTVPSGYYKALLGYKKSGTLGITGSTGGYSSIGFYFDHSAYSGDYMNMAMTVDALEAKVGQDFFINLVDKIGQGLAEKVESTKDDYWYK